MLNRKSKSKGVVTVIVIVAIVALFFVGVSGKKDGRFPWYQQIIIGVVSPFESLFGWIGGGFTGTFHNYFANISASKENTGLKTKLGETEIALAQMNEVVAENERLRALLGFKQAHLNEYVGARVIANDPRGDFRTIIIDRGSDDGVGVDMPVVAGSGLIGRVVEVMDGKSRVLLITDLNSAVDVMVARTRGRALLVGHTVNVGLRSGYALSRLEYLERTTDIVDNDTIITSGLDGLYPSGIPVGIVQNVRRDPKSVFLFADVVPFADLSNIEDVLVVKRGQ